MTEDPFQIKRAKIHKLSEEVPFTVLRLPRTKNRVKEEPHILYDFHYLRTGTTHQAAIDKAKAEFKNYGFPDGRFDPEWISGTFAFKNNHITIEPNWDTVKGFNFWVAEGSIGEYYNENDIKPFPKIRTNRQPTKKLYNSVITNSHEIEEYKGNLVDLLRDQEEACSIMLVPQYLDKIKAFHAAKGDCPAKIRIMNYGHIWNRFSTYFENPDTGSWYELQNKTPESVISKINGYTFRECDKVHIRRDHLFYDGSLDDIFLELKKAGVKYDRSWL